MNVFGELMAGLGLLFIGMQLIGRHLKTAVGRRLRGVLARAAVTRWRGLMAGLAAGALTQSSTAVTLIAANLMATRVLSIAQTIPIAAGANVGSALIVLIATVDTRLVVLYMLGIGGLAVLFKLDQKSTLRDWIWAGLGLALLFLGLDFIKHAPDELGGAAWQRLFDGLSPVSAVFTGLMFALVTHSALSVVILAVTAVHGGLLELSSTFWIMSGANLGSGLAILISGSGLRGSGKQLCQAHIIVKCLGTFVVALAWLAGGIAERAPELAASPAQILAMLFLAQQAAGGLGVVLLRDPILALTGRLTPVDPVEQASRPHYIYDRAIEDSSNAARLAALERDRLICALPDLLIDLDRLDDPQARRQLWLGHRSVVEQTRGFLAALITTGSLGDEVPGLLNQQMQLEYLGELQETLYTFSLLFEAPGERPPLLGSLCEALRMLVCLLAETVEQPGQASADLQDMHTLVALAADRGEMLDRLRRDARQFHAEQAQRLMEAATLFERAVWLVRRLASIRLAANQGSPALATRG